MLTMMTIAMVPFAASAAMELGAIMGVTIAVVVCTAIPLTTGVAKGHTTLGIIGALVTLPIAALLGIIGAFVMHPVASLLGCIGGLPVACVFAAIISSIPTQKNQSLLSHAEIEKEMQRIRGG